MTEGKSGSPGGRGPRGRVPDEPTAVIIRFERAVPVPDRPDVGDDLPEWLRPTWAKIRKHHSGVAIRGLFSSFDADEIQDLIDCAEVRDPAFVAPDFLAYFAVIPAAEEEVSDLRRRLRAWGAVRHLEISRPVSSPSPVVNADPHADEQGYLNPAEEGIDARFAWTIAGGDGAGQHLVDVERGWLLDHEDLVHITPSDPIHGAISSDPAEQEHGTSVLGVVCAGDNDKGGIGIVPGLARLDVSAYSGVLRAAAIMAAAIRLAQYPERGVLLIEAQAWAVEANDLQGPVEVSDADFDVIRTAVSCGIVVVEAGGNGTAVGEFSSPPPLDMDEYERDGERILSADPADEGYRDSGAIIVSCAEPATREPLSYSPRGHRVDCFAWGDAVYTCTSDSALYRFDFAGTSSAAAIIAGAALSLLGMARANGAEPLSPEDVREILRDRATGTLPAVDPTTDEPHLIGVMPDLRACIDSLKPRLEVQDLRPVPRARSFDSPNVIVRQGRYLNPQDEIGAGSPLEHATDLSERPRPGTDNYVYVRVLNRGGWSATDVVVNAYWSPAATLVPPSSWRPIGSTTIPVVPAGDVLTVAEIVWEAADVPSGVNCCIVAEVDCALDPSPVSSPSPWGEWQAFRRRHLRSDNLAWHNVQTVRLPSFGGTMESAFLFRGAPDVAVETRLEIEAHLPWNAQAALVTPASPRIPLGGPPLLPRRPGETRRWALRRQGVTRFDDIEIPAAARIPLVLELNLAWPDRARKYQIVARQMVGRRAVGRFTWNLIRGPRP